MTADGQNAYLVSGTLADAAITARVTIALPADSLTGSTGQAQTVDLSSINFELTQPPVPADRPDCKSH